MSQTLQSQIADAARHVEEARRAAYHNPQQLKHLVEQISVLADLRQQEGNYDKAESLYREAMFRVRDLQIPNPQLLSGINSLLAYLYDRWGKQDLAIQFYQEALAISKTMGESDPGETGTLKNNLAMIFKTQGRFGDAETHYLEALDCIQKADGDGSARVASVYNNLGVLYYSEMDAERALSMHEKALQIRRKLPPEEVEPGDVSQSYINLAAVYKAIGNFREAEENLDQASQLRTPFHEGEPNPRHAATLAIDRTT